MKHGGKAGRSMIESRLLTEVEYLAALQVGHERYYQAEHSGIPHPYMRDYCKESSLEAQDTKTEHLVKAQVGQWLYKRNIAGFPSPSVEDIETLKSGQMPEVKP